jgi:outer membrane autotransporter protein
MKKAMLQQQQINKGKLTVLVIALSGALTAMAPAYAQTPVTSSTIFNGTIDVTGNSSNGLEVSGTFTNLTNNGAITADLNAISIGTIAATSITGLTNTGTIISNASSGSAGISNFGTISTLTNSISGGTIGSISGATGIINGTIGTISTLTNYGTISGSIVGISNKGSVGALTNNGSISGTTAGISNYGAISALTNGTIGNTLSNISGGTIGISNIGSTANSAIGTIGALTNYGIISGTNAGISNTGGIGTLTNNGIIGGNTTTNGISNTGTITSLTNNGSIGGNNATNGISNTGTITSLTNSGTISGGKGIANSGSIGTLSNSGLIYGSTALDLTSGSTLTNFTNTGTIIGNINNATSTALTITGGTGTIFGTLTGVIGSIGTITNTGSNLRFAGNTYLNDDINVATNTVTNAGTLQVNSPLTITGNYVQGSGSSLIIGVTNNVSLSNLVNLSDVGYGRLVVLGAATLDGSSVTVKSTGSYALAQGQRYVVVAATGALSTVGATYSASGYTVTGTTVTETITINSVVTTYNDLVLTLGGATGTKAVNNATNSDAVSALGGLFNYGGTNANMLAVYNPATTLDKAAANKAGAQLSPASVTGAATQAANAATQAVSNVATSRMDSFRLARAGGSGVATGERATDIALWGQIFGGRATQGERQAISGYHANYRGLLLGADTAVSDTVRAGGLFSAAKTSVASDGDNTGSSANVNSYGLSAYATYTGEPWYVNAMAGAIHQQYSTVRSISYSSFSGIANGGFNGQQYSTSLHAGYPLSLNAWLPGATLTPIAGLSYSTLRADGYTESGGNGAALTVKSATSNSLKSELGAKLENSFDTSYGKLLPSVQLGWRHEFKDGAMQTGASFVADSTGSTAFVSKGASAVANLGVLNIGATLLQSQSLSLSAKYTLEAGGGYTAQTGSVQVRWQY